ncbi:hypothetical protein AGMMS49965_20860 [Bacteroidia bacterium]|nr:hypothetical protein AGMMS49965_20860 [Bacteroidia bacterium]
MERQQLYCEAEFLIQFFNNRPRISSDDSFSEDTEVDIWNKYRDMFLKDATLCLDVSLESFFKIENDFFNMLKKKKGNGEIKIKFDKFPINFDEADNRHAFFFLSDSTKSRQMEENYGMMFISNEDYIERANFLFSSVTLLSIDTNTNWDIVQAFRHPCNSIILIDNYILGKKDMEKEIKTLFDSLLPNKLEKQKFTVTIFTKKADNEDKIKQKENLKKAIKTLRNYTIEVNINDVDHSQHDRSLITNYCLFECGYGFVLDYNERVKGTRLYINRITQPKVYQAILNLEKKLTKVG